VTHDDKAERYEIDCKTAARTFDYILARHEPDDTMAVRQVRWNTMGKSLLDSAYRYEVYPFEVNL
jgi:hypothetical protein